MARLRPALLFDRGALTDWLIDQLTTALGGEVLLGDGVAPDQSGWPDSGEPGTGVYIPYTVLRTEVATPAPNTPVGSVEADAWNCSYSFDHFGSQRQQADWVADRVRLAWDGLSSGKQELGSGRSWGLGSFQITRMGAVSRLDQERPPLWQLTDAVSVLLSRGLGE